MTIGENIKRLREQAGMTQEDLGEILGITHSAVSLIESDKRGITVEKVQKIAKALGVTIYEILES